MSKLNIWETVYDGRRPRREELAPAVMKIIKEYGNSALSELVMEDAELKQLLSKMPIKMLYILRETLCELETWVSRAV